MKEKITICVPITEPSIKAAVDAANSTDADIIEVRLDFLRESCGMDRLTDIRKPVIATCMPEWEGGLFKGTEKERITILKEAVKYAAYVSIELNTKRGLRDELMEDARCKNVKTIVACHDFRKTPRKEDIIKTLEKEKDAGADIAKIAYHAKDYGDVLKTMQALTESKLGIPVIAVSMGEYGRISRVIGPLFGSYLTFASAGKGKESAPGQLTIDELKQVLGILKAR
ncbi:MAG: type I 3-dehydroquinate dehydratase [Candidatus Altiarchaeota archaeon]|nr:type I 3-dehydroquinate dehydratase [Candidatus Altiarchaeota archaeon]